MSEEVNIDRVTINKFFTYATPAADFGSLALSPSVSGYNNAVLSRHFDRLSTLSKIGSFYTSDNPTATLMSLRPNSPSSALLHTSFKAERAH